MLFDRRRALIICSAILAGGLAACSRLPIDLFAPSGDTGSGPLIITATLPPADATATASAPTLTPTPFTALDRNVLWVGIEGRGRAVAAVWPDGTVIDVPLPLNAGQQASDMIASADGLYLAYLVWEPDDALRGIAVWPLADPNARLIARPDPEYRIVGMAFASDSSALAYTEVGNTQPVQDADWRLSIIPANGGEPARVLDRTGADNAPPLTPFDWRVNSGLFVEPVVASEGTQGIYVVDPASGATHLLVQVDGGLSPTPRLSPDGRRLAYVDLDPSHSGPPGSGNPLPNVVRVVNLASSIAVTMAPPDGEAISGVRWHPDNLHLLLDVVTPSPDDPAQPSQYWALAEVGEDPPWESSTPDVNRAALFDFAPFAGGVAYTLLPGSEASWALVLLPDFASTSEPLRVSLESIAEKFGAPVILRSP